MNTLDTTNLNPLPEQVEVTAVRITFWNAMVLIITFWLAALPAACLMAVFGAVLWGMAR